ncbi:MAG: hypothetical protein BWY60_00639 [Actinobacteria bacterium ADurb.Bin346]|nr:MAG: hypothetical protein BWY60_00639 [Actinobacteria bacterium ADurb.Bin346]
MQATAGLLSERFSSWLPSVSQISFRLSLSFFCFSYSLNSLRPLKILRTTILFWVNVPVLSVQITETLPRVSTELSLRTIALFLAIFWTPSAREIVTIAGRPSGIEATARATATRNISEIISPLVALDMPCDIAKKPLSIPAKKTTALTERQIIPILVPTVFNSFCKGVISSFSWTRLAIFPISVFLPVLVTIALHLPFVMVVPENSIFTLSPSGRLSLVRASVNLSTGRDSPVIIDSFA